MTLTFIRKILEREGESPMVLNNCVMTMSNKRKRQLIFSLSPDKEHIIRELDVIYADNHNRVLRKDVSVEQDVEEIIMNAIEQIY